MSEIIVALDYSNKKDCFSFLDKLEDELSWVKIGMQLFYKEGPSLVSEIKNRNYKIFLDLKLHDIPTTVKKTIESLNDLSIDMTNVHCSGALEMLRAAQSAAAEKCLLIGVTQLTSTSEQVMKEQIKISSSLEQCVLDYAKLAKEAGLKGVVCSAQETTKIKEQLGKEFLTVCPGIRLDTANKNDQVRVCSPKEAVRLGADFLVIGRSITESSKPKETIIKIKESML